MDRVSDHVPYVDASVRGEVVSVQEKTARSLEHIDIYTGTEAARRKLDALKQRVASARGEGGK